MPRTEYAVTTARARADDAERSPRSPGRSSTMPCSRGSRPIPSGGRTCSSTSCGPAWSTRVRSVRCGWPDRARRDAARTGRSRPPRCGSRRRLSARHARDLGYVARSVRAHAGDRPAPAARRATAQPSRRVHPHEPHWYLAVLGTDPSFQRTGAGTALLEPVLARVDAEGLPAYLETQKEANLAWYGRFGFDVVERARSGRRARRSGRCARSTPCARERRIRLQLRHAESDHGDARHRAPDRAGADGLHRPGAARVGGVERGRARHHRDVVGPARRGARRDREDARPHRQAVRRQHRAAVRARPEHRRLRRRERRDVRDDLGRRSDEVHAGC